MPVFETGSRGFDPHLWFLFVSLWFKGRMVAFQAIDPSSSLGSESDLAVLAQLVARNLDTVEVGGSNPSYGNLSILFE